MNGKLRADQVTRILTDTADALEPREFTVAEIRDMLAAVESKLVAKASVNLFNVAFRVLTDNNCELTESKIQAIRAVRDETQCGLKEAKDAVEQALPAVYFSQAEEILRALTRANNNVSPQYRHTIYAENYSEVIYTVSDNRYESRPW